MEKIRNVHIIILLNVCVCSDILVIVVDWSRNVFLMHLQSWIHMKMRLKREWMVVEVGIALCQYF